ncbi:MAG: permease-like cell division protein FtsX [Candidatus Onthomonas sp.]
MRRFNFGYYIKEGLHGAGSHGFMTFASIGIMASCLIIMGSFALIAMNLEYNLNSLMAENEFLAYVDENLTDEEGEELTGQIEGIDNVAEVRYITREEALEDYVGGLEDDSLYRDLPASVLRGRFSIRVTDIEQLQDTITQVRDVEGIVKTSAALDVADGFVTLRNVTVIIALLMVVVLVIVSLFIISNAIKLATSSREGEIAIMKMVGATNSFVRWPFVIEGILLGVGSALLAFLVQWGVYELLVQAVSVYSHVQLINMIPFEQIRVPMLIAFGGIGLIVGVLGSLVTIRKFLRV